MNTDRSNHQWKGGKVGKHALHTWVRRRLPKSKVCDDCGQKRKLDLANISQKYKRDIKDWEWLCRKCHMTKDGRLDGLLKMVKQDRSNLKRYKLGEFERHFGAKIRAERNAQGMRAEEIATKLGLSVASLYDFEMAKRGVKIFLFIKIARILNKPLSHFVCTCSACEKRLLTPPSQS